MDTSVHTRFLGRRTVQADSADNRDRHDWQEVSSSAMSNWLGSVSNQPPDLVIMAESDGVSKMYRVIDQQVEADPLAKISNDSKNRTIRHEIADQAIDRGRLASILFAIISAVQSLLGYLTSEHFPPERQRPCAAFRSVNRKVCRRIAPFRHPRTLAAHHGSVINAKARIHLLRLCHWCKRMSRNQTGFPPSRDDVSRIVGATTIQIWKPSDISPD